MQISFTQKLGITLIRFAMSVLWIIDCFSVGNAYHWSKIYRIYILMFLLFVVLSLSGVFIIQNKESVYNYLSSKITLNIIKSTTQIENIPTEENSEIVNNNNESVDSQPSKIQSEKDNNVMGVSSEAEYPKLVSETEPVPVITAKSVLVVDLDSDKTLFEINGGRVMAPASTSKLMTALLSLDKYNKDDVLVVPKDCTHIDSTKAWLPAGEQFTVEDLMYATLVSSAGDAACTLASGIKADSQEAEQSDNNFVFDMNQKAKKLGMKNTFFTNAVGLDGVASSHYSTAGDLYLLMKEAVSKDLIRDIVKTKNFKIKSYKGDFTYMGVNTNKLLWEIEGTVGVKTGTTTAAGEVLIYQYSKDGRNIAIIIMGSNNRFEDTEKLLIWSLGNYIWSE